MNFSSFFFPHFALEKSMPWPELQHKISIEIASPRGREQNHQPPQIPTPPPPPRLSTLLTLERHHYNTWHMLTLAPPLPPTKSLENNRVFSPNTAPGLPTIYPSSVRI